MMQGLYIGKISGRVSEVWFIVYNKIKVKLDYNIRCITNLPGWLKQLKKMNNLWETEVSVPSLLTVSHDF